MRLFEECWRRVDRAGTHADAFIAVWNDLLDADSYSFQPKMKNQRTGVLSAKLLVPMDAHLALILGEFFYQLRAALDGAIYRAVDLKRGAKQITGINKLEFPICINPTKFNDSGFHFNPFPDKLRPWLEEIQPYNAKKTIGKEYVGINDVLKLLHDCARKDRHRQLHVVAAIPSTAKGTVFVDPPAKLGFIRMLPANLLKGEGEFIEFGIENAIANTTLHFNGKFTIEVSVDEIPGIANEGFLKVLGQLKGATEYILNRFERDSV